MVNIPTTRLDKNDTKWNQQRKTVIHQSPIMSVLKLIIAGAIIMLFALVLMMESANAMASEPVKELAPEQLIEQTGNEMLNALQQQREDIKQNPRLVYALADDIVLPHFDTQRMSALVLGKYWRKATDEQKSQFPNEFRKLLLRTYATAMAEYSDEKIVVLPVRKQSDENESKVRTEIQRGTGPAIPVAYRLHKTAGGWKVYDISIDGISLLSNYRRNFVREVRRNGVGGLMKKLSYRNMQVASK